MPTIAAMVNTYNEAANIAACLSRLAWVDELVVVDSGSSDDTIAIARACGAKVVSVAPGDFSQIRNAGLQHIESDWILVVDADEWVPEELSAEIQQCIRQDSACAGYYLPRKNYFMGHWVKGCGWYPDYVLRLFRNRPAHRYNGKVHERVCLSGKTAKLRSPMRHNTYVSMEQYIAKLNRYTTLSAQMMNDKKRRIGLPHLLLRPPLEFFKMFILRRGFADGMYGFIVSALSAMYVFVKFTKAWLNQRSRHTSSDCGERTNPQPLTSAVFPAGEAKISSPKQFDSKI